MATPWPRPWPPAFIPAQLGLPLAAILLALVRVGGPAMRLVRAGLVLARPPERRRPLRCLLRCPPSPHRCRRCRDPRTPPSRSPEPPRSPPSREVPFSPTASGSRHLCDTWPWFWPPSHQSPRTLPNPHVLVGVGLILVRVLIGVAGIGAVLVAGHIFGPIGLVGDVVGIVRSSAPSSSVSPGTSAGVSPESSSGVSSVGESPSVSHSSTGSSSCVLVPVLVARLERVDEGADLLPECQGFAVGRAVARRRHC